MYNLIDNAIKFSHNDSVIYIQAVGQYEKVFVSVKDTGIGIPKDSLKKYGNAFTKPIFPAEKTKRNRTWPFHRKGNPPVPWRKY